jgi:hypothetical protein
MNDNLDQLTENQRKGWEIINALGEQQEKIFDTLIGEPVWRSADGRVLPISKMSDAHLANAIKMIERSGDLTEKYQQLREEFSKRVQRTSGKRRFKLLFHKMTMRK